MTAKKKLIVPLSLLGLLITIGVVAYSVNTSKKKSVEAPPPVAKTPELKAVTALGRIEPQGEVIQLSPSNSHYENDYHYFTNFSS